MDYVSSIPHLENYEIVRVDQLSNVDPSGLEDGSLLIFDNESKTWKVSESLEQALDGNNSTLRIRRGVNPSSLAIGEVCFDEINNTLYYGSQSGIIAIAGSGKYVTRDTGQTITGDKTFTGKVYVETPTEDKNPATKYYVDTITSVAYSLTNMVDVDKTGLTDGSVLIFNSQSSKWKVDQTDLNLTDGGNF